MEDDIAQELISSPEIEILPPEREDFFGTISQTCLCCGRPRHFLDDDGCGICDECLAP